MVTLPESLPHLAAMILLNHSHLSIFTYAIYIQLFYWGVFVSKWLSTQAMTFLSKNPIFSACLFILMFLPSIDGDSRAKEVNTRRESGE